MQTECYYPNCHKTLANIIMKILITFTFFSLTGLTLFAQSAWIDTVKTPVNLKGFKLTNKVVKAEYGKVIMYFNQIDYLKRKVKEDTFRITPKYFSEQTIADLLKEGRVKIVRRSDDSVETEITHYLKQDGSTCDRIFELHDGVDFFFHLEIIGIMDAYAPSISDTVNSTEKDTTTQVKEFAYADELADITDTARIKIKDYFPSKPSFHYVYNDNNGYGELDTNICKSVKLNRKDIFYFAECYNKFGIVSIGTTMFGPGIYFYQNDSLFTIEADYEEDIKEKKLGDAALLIPALIKPGDSSILDLGMNKQVFTYLKREDLKIGNITHKDCIKLKIKEYWPHTIYIGYVWLKKGFGLVKWMRSTGLIEELVGSF